MTLISRISFNKAKMFAFWSFQSSQNKSLLWIWFSRIWCLGQNSLDWRFQLISRRQNIPEKLHFLKHFNHELLQFSTNPKCHLLLCNSSTADTSALENFTVFWKIKFLPNVSIWTSVQCAVFDSFNKLRNLNSFLI